jgi:uncharacterized protein (TIGR03000 family)
MGTAGSYYRGGTGGYYRPATGYYNGAYYRSGYNRGYYPYYYNRYYYPYGFVFGLGLGFGFWPSFYGGPGLGYIDPGYYWGNGQSLHAFDTYPPPPEGQSYPPPPGMESSPFAPPDFTVHLTVIVPPQAEVWFEEEKTSQTGSIREFDSPPIPPGRLFSYAVKARWPDSGKFVEIVRQVTVKAGDRTTVDFSSPAGGERLGMPHPVDK